MNARQKAKHYKKLYEQAKFPTHTVYYTSSNLDHLVANSKIDNELFLMMIKDLSDNAIKQYHVQRIADQLEKDVIPKYIDISEDKGVARFHLWVRRQ